MRVKAILPAVALAVAFIAVPGGYASAQTNNPKPNSDNQPPVVVAVVAGDTLAAIAASNNTTYLRLYNANDQIQDPDLIYPGQQIRVPFETEQLADRPLPQKVQVQVQAEAQAARGAAAVRPAPAAEAPPVRPKASSYTLSGSNLGVWDRLAQCESGGNWAINTGNGFYGGLQFTLSSWRAVGGTGLPSNASREEQIARAQSLQARQGWGAWPACSAKLGLR